MHEQPVHSSFHSLDTLKSAFNSLIIILDLCSVFSLEQYSVALRHDTVRKSSVDGWEAKFVWS